jgi:hypothetical protein
VAAIGRGVTAPMPSKRRRGNGHPDPTRPRSASVLPATMPSGDSTNYEHETLCEQIWAEPVRDVAKGRGVCDVYLARVCRKLSVPLPGRGYWAKAKAGQSPQRPPLLALKADETRRLAMWQRRYQTRQVPKIGKVGRLDVAAPLVVAATLTEPHPLVARVERCLRRANVRDGVVSGRRCGLLDLAVGPEGLDRALRVYDAFPKGAEAAGLTVEVERPAESAAGEAQPDPSERQGGDTRVLCHDEWLGVRLFEEVDYELDPTPRRPRRRPEDPIWYVPSQTPSYMCSPPVTSACRSPTSLAPVRGLWRGGQRRSRPSALRRSGYVGSARRRSDAGTKSTSGGAPFGAPRPADQ